MKYKKYILFHIEDYYPVGGLRDIIADADTINELQTVVIEDERADETVYYIIDRDTWREVWRK